MNRYAAENLEKIVMPSIIGFFSLLILLSLTDLAPFSLANEDMENARGVFVEVGVHGLAAIFAIVISFTLMAVEFASQEYTHRIMDIHLKSLVFWSVIVIYLGSLFYNILMLGALEEPVNSKYVEVSMLLTLLCLVILVPYFFITMIRLRPESVISRLLTKIDKEYVNSLKGLLKEDKLNVKSESDKMLPITEIIERSITKGDRSTARFGLDEIQKCYMHYLNEENGAYVSPYFLNHILSIGREAIIEADDDSVVQVLKIFGEVGTHTISKKMDLTTKMVLENIDIIGFKVLKDYDVATQQMINSLQDMLSTVIKINEDSKEILAKIFVLYHDASNELFTLKKYRMTKYMVRSFSELFDLMVENKHCDAIERTAGLLESIGVFAVNLDIRDVLHQSVHSLHKIGISSAKNNLVWDTPKGTLNIAERVIDHLLKVEGETLKYKSKSKEFDIIINEIEYAKKDIEKYLEKGVDFSDLWH